MNDLEMDKNHDKVEKYLELKWYMHVLKIMIGGPLFFGFSKLELAIFALMFL